MIPRASITAWRAGAPWALDEQVEQDLGIHRAIVEIFSDADLGRALASRNGTALHKLYLTPPSRCSEDIDLVQVRAEQFGDVMNALRNKLTPARTPAAPRRATRLPALMARFRPSSAVTLW